VQRSCARVLGFARVEEVDGEHSEPGVVVVAAPVGSEPKVVAVVTEGSEVEVEVQRSCAPVLGSVLLSGVSELVERTENLQYDSLAGTFEEFVGSVVVVA